MPTVEYISAYLEQNYAVRDKQDVLAMCALQFASQSEQKQLDISQDYDLSFNRLKNLDKKLSDLLTK